MKASEARRMKELMDIVLIHPNKISLEFTVDEFMN